MAANPRNRHHRHSKIVRTARAILEKEEQMRVIGRISEADGLKTARDIIQIEFKITDIELTGDDEQQDT